MARDSRLEFVAEVEAAVAGGDRLEVATTRDG